jgi:hypothetical protein
LWEITFTISAVAWEMRDGGWLTSSQRGYFWLYWMVGIRVMTTGEHLSWILMDELLVESLGLTKACDTSQSYSQLQMFLLACPDTFIIDNNMRRDRPWLRAWRVSRPRLHDMSTFTAYNRSEVDRVGQTVETWCMMVSIIDQVTTDEHRGLPTVISLTQEQLARLEVINFQVFHGIWEFTWLAGCFTT